jgi:16S rRNA (cytidine1402-2'-O)-methyltransferase
MKQDQSSQSAPSSGPGTLYVVATPIGNLEDITLRAIRILKEVGLIAAEDTRHTRKLLSHLGIHTPLVSYYKDREQERATLILERLQSGIDVALVSDAGTPAISDPGAVLVGRARQEGIRVVPVPGASALAATVSASGMTGDHFLFLGFLPAQKKERVRLLQEVAHRQEMIVFYETPRRIRACLADCLAVLGDRSAFLARELTKLHEETMRQPLSAIAEELGRREVIKGEFVVLLAGAQPPVAQPDDASLTELLRWYCEAGEVSLKDAVRLLTRDLGLPRSEVYREALRVWQEEAVDKAQ